MISVQNLNQLACTGCLCPFNNQSCYELYAVLKATLSPNQNKYKYTLLLRESAWDSCSRS